MTNYKEQRGNTSFSLSGRRYEIKNHDGYRLGKNGKAQSGNNTHNFTLFYS